VSDGSTPDFLQGIQMSVVPAAEAAWETPPGDAVFEALPDPAGATAAMSADPDGRATFLFRTAENGRGILQIIGVDRQAGALAVTLRYRLLEPGTVRPSGRA